MTLDSQFLKTQRVLLTTMSETPSGPAPTCDSFLLSDHIMCGVIKQNESEVGKRHVTCFRTVLYSKYTSIEFWNQTLVNSAISDNIRSLLHQCTSDKCLVLTLTLTLYLNEINRLKLVTCHCWLPTHSAWSPC